MAPVNSAQLYRPSKLQLSCELVSPTSTCQTSTMKEILYVKVNGCVGVFVFGFFGDGESYIVKKSLSKINPNNSRYIKYQTLVLCVIYIRSSIN